MYTIREQEIYVSEIVQFLNTSFEGEDIIVCRPSNIDNLTDHSVIYVEEADSSAIARIKASSHILVIASKPIDTGKNALIITTNPKLAFVQIVREFFMEQNLPAIHPTAQVAPQAAIAPNVTIGEFCVIGPEVSIESGTEILSGVVITGKVRIGKNCLIKNRAVIGSEGYGFVFDESGTPVHFPQIGRIIVGNDVWIGANTTVERSAFQDTVIGDSVKIDDLVHIGNGCRIDANTMITAGTVLSENVSIGSNCWLMPNVSVRNNITISPQVTIGIGSVVVHDLPANSTFVGNPAHSVKKIKQ